MQIITIQNRCILNQFKDNVYRCKYKSNYYTQYRNIYDKITMIMNNELPIRITSLPIWSFYRLGNGEADIQLTKYNVNDIKSKIGYISDDDNILLTLEVPKDMCLLSDFYRWVDYMDKIQENQIVDNIKDILDFDINNLYNTIQCTLPYIHKEWITGIYKLSDFKYNDYEDRLNQMHLCKYYINDTNTEGEKFKQFLMNRYNFNEKDLEQDINNIIINQNKLFLDNLKYLKFNIE